MLKKLALVAMLAYDIAVAQQTAMAIPTTSQPVLEPGVVYSTSNLVNWTPPNTTAPSTLTTSPWINGVYQQNLTCWYGGDPGNCGPKPTVTPGNINFSYGTTDIHQVTSIAAALPNSGTGLNVNGFNFAFAAKNGNGWDNGQQDYLMAYVKFYGPNGNTVANYDYNLNYKFDWTYFNVGKTFDTPYASKDLTAAQYGFIGRDNNYWAGTYGPEITNISFSLKYSVDPCATNPMFSTTCPGYLDALAKLVPSSPVTTVDPITTTSVSPMSTTTIITDPVAATVNSISSTNVGQPSVVASVVSAPAPTTTSTTASTASSSSTSSSSQTTKESSSSNGNVSLALSVIGKNSERDAAGAAVAQSAVAQAQQAANQAQQEANSVASNAVSNSLSANIVGSNIQQSNGNGIRVNQNSNSTNFSLQSGVTNLASVVTSPSTNGPVLSQQQSSSIGLNVLTNQSVITTNQSIQQSTNNTNTFALPLLQPTQASISLNVPVTVTTTTQTQSQPTSLPTNSSLSQGIETYSILPPNFLTDKTNPMNDIVEGKQTVPQSTSVAMIGPVVNKNASDNDAAGGIKIERMATAPTGYGDYLNFTMRDVAFYAPKEVYKNQRNVDNQRALRTLTNDNKHKEMVEMQYGK